MSPASYLPHGLPRRVFGPLTASITSEVRDNYFHVTMEGTLNKISEIKFSVGCMVWPRSLKIFINKSLVLYSIFEYNDEMFCFLYMYEILPSNHIDANSSFLVPEPFSICCLNFKPLFLTSILERSVESLQKYSI